MKANRLLSVALGAFLLSTLAGLGQNYDLSWFTIDGGGGTSRGGAYSLSGTIGQPDAGVMTGGNYTLIGGFWGAAVAVQTEGAPLLTIRTAGSSVVISWPSPSTGFSLFENGSLATKNWNLVGQTVQDNGVTKSITVPLPIGSKFYRLQK